MAIRTIRLEGDELLRKRSKPVKDITPNVLTLLDDMAETLYAKDGLGLAAPQVGVLKRIVVVNIEGEITELINPEIVDESGTQNKMEGCLSIPGKMGMVERPARVRVRAQDRHGNEIFLEGEDMQAVLFCHEIDHLNGVLYIDKATRMEDARLRSDDDEDDGEVEE